MSLMAWRFSLYFAWNLTDAGVTASGLSYNGLDKQGNDSWDRVIMIHSLKTITMLSISDKIWNWNIPI